MAIPEQIRKQTEAVQELYKQLNPGDNTGAGASPADGTANRRGRRRSGGVEEVEGEGDAGGAKLGGEALSQVGGQVGAQGGVRGEGCADGGRPGRGMAGSVCAMGVGCGT